MITTSRGVDLPKSLPKQKTKTRGIPEFQHPPGFMEYFSTKSGKRHTNFPDFKPVRTKDGLPYIGFDFDEKLNMTTITFLMIQVLYNSRPLYYRPSTSRTGIHIAVPYGMGDQFLNDYEDHVRQHFTRLRGYEWFWKEKNGMKEMEWQELRYLDIFELSSVN